jgi:hypothetical protein
VLLDHIIVALAVGGQDNSGLIGGSVPKNGFFMSLRSEHHHPHAPLNTSPHEREVDHNVSASLRQSIVPPDDTLFRHICEKVVRD